MAGPQNRFCAVGSVVGMLSAAVVLHPIVSAQSGQLPDAAAATFRAGVETVVVSVTVRDSSNQLVTTLGRNDFRLFVDGRPANVDVFSLERRPLMLGILLSTSLESGVARIRDPSMGMGWIPFPGLLFGLDKAFLPLLGPHDDLRIGSFGGQRLTFSRATSTAPAARLGAFREVITPGVVPLADFYGASRVWDAVAAAAKQLSSDSPFRSIVLVTDGQSSGNRIGHADAIAAAVSHGVVVHVVGRKSEWQESVAPSPETFVGRLAEQTGGLLRIDEAPFERHRISWDKPARVFRDIVNAIHNSYEIRLNVGSVAEGAHQLDFRIGVTGMRVHAPAWLITGESRQRFDQAPGPLGLPKGVVAQR